MDSPPDDSPPKPKKESLKKKTISRKKDQVEIYSATGAPSKPAEPPKIDSKGNAKPGDKPYTIQVAAFKAAGDADKLVAELKQKGFSAYRAIGKVPGQGIWYRVRVGDYSTRAEAGDTFSKLQKAGIQPMVVEK